MWCVRGTTQKLLPLSFSLHRTKRFFPLSPSPGLPSKTDQDYSAISLFNTLKLNPSGPLQHSSYTYTYLQLRLNLVVSLILGMALGKKQGVLVVMVVLLSGLGCVSCEREKEKGRRNAYATMMYVGTPRDYEFYVAIRVLLKSLATLDAQADRVVIASQDVPPRWIRAL